MSFIFISLAGRNNPTTGEERTRLRIFKSVLGGNYKGKKHRSNILLSATAVCLIAERKLMNGNEKGKKKINVL
jgi:hypothetical protein